MTDINLIKQALEYLEDNQHHIADHERHAYVMLYNDFITTLKDRLAQETALQALHNENERLGLYKDAYAEQEPVAWMTINAYGEEDDIHYENPSGHLLDGWTYKPLYTHQSVTLRRGDILRCIETDELCTVWSTSITGKTLVKWSANNFGDYTAEQIGELFWLEPKQEQEPVRLQCVTCGTVYADGVPPQRTEQNFCSRCGKRTPDSTHIHTCTPPKENT
jgi:hypothetical protein